MTMTEPAAPTVVGRYVLHAPIARGGMATIHLARLHGAEGFSRTVAAKRLHPQFAEDAEFVRMLLDEARIASKIHHPNVVPVLDVVQAGTEVILVEEYVHGVPLDKLLRAAAQQRTRMPVNVVVAILSGVLAGLTAVHEAKDELGQPLEVVHRDVSPQNVMVGVDGVPRLLDFGVAKATVNTHLTRVGMFKGKLAYTSPEQLRGVVTRLTDVYAVSVVLWEAIAGRRLYQGLHEAELVAAVHAGDPPKLTEATDRTGISPAQWLLIERLEPIIHKGMAAAMADRFATAVELQDALLRVAPAATATEVSKWVRQLGSELLDDREKVIATEESSFRRNRLSVAVSDAVADPSLLGVASVHGQISSSVHSQLRSQVAGSLQASMLPPGPLQMSVPVAGPSRGRVEWAIVAGLLIIGALLSGILAVMWRKPVIAASGRPMMSAGAVPEEIRSPAPPPVVSVVATAVQPPITTASPPAPAPSPPSRVRATPAHQAPPVRPAVSAPAPAPVAVAPQPSPAADCTTPFYFDGKKKTFKPGCL